MFFSMISDPRDEVMAVEIFLQIEEDYCVIPDELIFFRELFLRFLNAHDKDQ